MNIVYLTRTASQGLFFLLAHRAQSTELVKQVQYSSFLSLPNDVIAVVVAICSPGGRSLFLYRSIRTVLRYLPVLAQCRIQ